MTQRTSGERFLPKQGGFETRPYKSPDLGAALIALITLEHDPEKWVDGSRLM